MCECECVRVLELRKILGDQSLESNKFMFQINIFSYRTDRNLHCINRKRNVQTCL
jgi:hypothetical protein